MIERTYGSLDKRQLHVRLYKPFYWWRSREFDFWVKVYRGSHRCYCPDGWLCDGRICLFGWGVTWFYSSYDGEIPCPCDKVIDGWQYHDMPKVQATD